MRDNKEKIKKGVNTVNAFLSKTNTKKLTGNTLLVVGIFVYSFILVALGELAAHHSLSQIFIFLSLDNVFLAVANTSLLIGLIITFLTFITTKLSIGIGVTSVVTIVLFIADGMKILFRSEPLYTWDFAIAGEAANVLGSVGLNFSSAMILGIIFVLFSIAASIIFDIKFSKKLLMKYRFQIIPSVVCVLLFVICWNTLFTNSYMEKHNLHAVNWEQVRSYKRNGLIYSMLSNKILAKVTEPENYSEETINKIISKTTIGENETVKPNIIIFMSEAYSDIENAKNVTFSKDINENFDKLSNDFMSGRCLTRQFGGGTANSEFEVLTGLSASLLPPGTIAYTSYVNKSTPNFVSYLNSIGYYTTASHPYIRSFFSRESAYEDMGFAEFHSEENFGDAQRKRAENYITDDALVDKIISLYEQNKQSGKPFFNHSVSMQNHSSYWPDEFKGEDLVTASTNADITDSEHKALETYASGIALSDKALGKLVEYFEKVSEPTVILYFGDHQPYLSEDTFTMLQKIGYLSSDELEANYKYYSTPYLIWNNFDKEKQNEKQSMSMFHLLPYMTDKLNMVRPDYYYFMNDFFSECKGFTDRMYLDSQGAPTTTQTEDAVVLTEEFKMLQYDILHGNRYCKESFYNK